MRIVDVHEHYYTGPEFEKRYDPRVLMGSGVLHQAWLLSGNGYFGATDEEILALCRLHPDFFVPFGCLDFRAGIERINYLFQEGCVGLKACFPDEPYDSERYFPLYRQAEALHMPILFHVGGAFYVSPSHPATVRGPGLELKQTYGRNMLPIHMDAIAKAFPKLVIIMAHLGGDVAYFDQAALICRGNSRVRGRAGMYLDLSSELTYDSLTALNRVAQVIQCVGPENILYGSDTHWLNAANVAQFWWFFLSRTLRLSEADLGLIFSGNANQIVCSALTHRNVTKA